jgi:hypothetical protein
MALLDGLLSVDWAAVHHAYGPATDVPALLRALVDPASAPESISDPARRQNRSVRVEVMSRLWGNLFHQGTIWQATAKAVPFLFAILKHGPDDPQLKSFLLRYLHHLGCGYPSDYLPDTLDPETMFRTAKGLDEAAVDALCLKKHEDFDEAERQLYDRAPPVWSKQCYLAVEAVAPEAFAFIGSDDEEVALEAIALAASFPRVSAPAIPLLRAQSGASPVRRANAVVVLAQIVGAEAVKDAERALASPDPLVALHGACALALADPGRVDARAMSILTAPAEELHEQPSPLTDQIGTLVKRCLALVPTATS